MKKYIPLFLLITLHVLLAQKSTNVIVVPKGEPVSDLSINENGWRSAAKFNTDNGGELFLLHDDNYLYVGFRGIFAPWSHLYINNRNKVYVLHVTASMGRVIYNMNQYDETWYPDRRFNWKMRHEEYDPGKNIDPNQFLKDEGWVPNINSNGEKKEVVFKISIKKFDKRKINLAFVYGLKGNVYQFWPKTLNDDSLKPEIFTGYNPSELKFDFNKWALLKLSE